MTGEPVRKFGSLALTAALAASLLAPAAATAAPDGESPDRSTDAATTVVPPPADPSDYEYGEGEDAREYFVRLEGVPAALYTGDDAGPATARQGRDGKYEFQAESQATASYRAQLETEQGEVVTDRAADVVGRELDLLASFTVANHGFATEMTPAEARRLGQLDEVTWIQEMREYFPLTDRGPSWMNAEGPVWDRPDDGTATGTTGEGVVVGVIDTGINPSSPSFADVSADGYDHDNPRGEGNYVGSCDPDNVEGGDGEGVILERFGLAAPDTAYYDEDLAELCNDKLIGMWGYNTVTGEYDDEGNLVEEGTPIDYSGHGSHTAGTAAGGFADGVEADTGDTEVPGNDFDVSGVAPHANVIAYGACCSGIGLISAIDQIVVDDVDVLNFSIGSSGATANLLQDPLTFGFLVARLNDIHVANSAGNAGPGPETIGSPSDAPWLTAVAASTHDRLNQNVLTDLTADGGATLEDIQGKGVSDPLDDQTPIVYAGNYEDNALCEPDIWGDDVFDGEIVVCDRGLTGRVDKAVQAEAAGAGGFVLANDEANAGSIPASLSGDSFPIPGVHITYDDGLELKAWIAENIDPSATIAGTSFDIDESYGDIVSIFSSRGASQGDTNVLSPHVTAPGVDILAPYGTDDSTEYQFISGTSMSSPHVAGALALLVEDSGGDLSPSEAQSALQLTARRDVLDTDGETPADPYDIGSGHVDVDAATRTGLVMDEDFDAYIDAVLDGTFTVDQDASKELNLASMAQTQCVLECSWERTFTGAPGTGTVTWDLSGSGDEFGVEVEPSTFTVSAGETQTVTVTAMPEAVEPDVTRFGSLELTNDAADVPDAHLPIVIESEGFAPDEPIELVSDGYTDEETLTFTAAGADDLQIAVDGLTPGDLELLEIAADPTNSDLYDDLSQVAVRLVEVPEDAAQLIAAVGQSTAQDIDLAVGRDTNGDGLPQPGEQLCLSASSGNAERCTLEEPEAGSYWVLVQNWAASGPGATDTVALTTAVPEAGDAGNLTATGPESVGPQEEFDVDLAWDLEAPSTLWFGALTLGSDEDDAEQLTLPIELEVVTEAPVADAGGPYEVTVGEVLQLDGTGSTHPTDRLEVTDWAWDLSNLDVPDATGPRPQVTPTVSGEYVISLTVGDATGARSVAADTASVTVTVVEPAPNQVCDDVEGESFSDVDSDPPHGGNIACVAGYGIARGFDDGTFGPLQDIRRDQMASFLARTLEVGGFELPTTPASAFPDDSGNEHELEVDQLAEVGIIKGNDDGDFDPFGRVSRGQMAAFLRRTVEFALDENLTAAGSDFTDIADSEHVDDIEIVAGLDIARGVSSTTYAPTADVTRAQMGTFLARTLQVMGEEGIELAPIDRD
jgi:subtilisin family serine protease